MTRNAIAIVFGVLQVLMWQVGAVRAQNDLHVPEKIKSHGFMSGADISGLPVMEQDGVIYRDENGQAHDAIELMYTKGLTWFRLRIFVEPNHVDMVVNDLDYTLALAKRVKAAGGKLLLDFHYSDTWADPGKQFKPKSWKGLSLEELAERVELHSYDVIKAMRREGVMPEMVQIGNEISHGMIWPDGRLRWNGEEREASFDRLATLIKAGIRGVKRASGKKYDPILMLHLAKGGSWTATKRFFTKIFERDVQFDVIGFSYYPRYHGKQKDLRENLQKTVEVFKKPVIVVEVGYAWRDIEKEPKQHNFEFPGTKEGQASYMQAVMDEVDALPNGMGVGAFWWHAEATPSKNKKAWLNGRNGLFDDKNRVLPAMSVLGKQLRVPIVRKAAVKPVGDEE